MTIRFETAGPACAKNPSLPIKRAALCYLNIEAISWRAKRNQSGRFLAGHF